jgi:thiopurine S-methyltransferase
MEHDFWHQRWEQNQIAFHEGAPNALLTTHLPALGLHRGARLFLPLCGKTRDIHWLLAQGHRIVGAELNLLAVTQLFAELGVAPDMEAVGSLVRYRAKDIEVYQGDIFALTPATLGAVDAVYDRAALVALPEQMRPGYAAHEIALGAGVPQLLITFDYDQAAQPGPPFAVSPAEVQRLYGHAYDIALKDTVDVPGGLKGKCPAVEQAWVLRSR